MKSFLRFAWNVILLMSLIAWFPVGCLFISIGYEQNFGKETKLPVGDTIPENFPVLVILPTTNEEKYTAEFVYYADLAKYKSEHPDFQFLIPDGHEEHIANSISEKTQLATSIYDGSELPYSAWVEMTPLEDGKQAFEVSYQENDDVLNRGWYEASAYHIEPLFHQSIFWPRESLENFLVGFIPMFILYAVIGVRRHLTRRRRKRAEATQQDGGAEET